MKKCRRHLYLILFVLSVFSTTAAATPFINPFPGILGDDLDDPGVFAHEDLVFTLELFDLAEYVPLLSGAVFGFYFVDDPDTLIPIFDPLDDTGVLDPQEARIDFTTGLVTDLDASTVQSDFSGSSLDGDIGFYLTPVWFTPGLTYRTESFRNPNGLDAAGTYPILNAASDYDYLIAFILEWENPNTGQEVVLPVGVEAAGGIAPVPEPSTLMLLAFSVTASSLLLRRHRWRRRR